MMEMTMAHVFNTHAPANRPSWSALGALDSPLAWLRRWRQRRELWGVLGMPDYLLKDIGLQRHDIVQEAVKPFWRR